ncbi:MAG TPA: hypothetical protein VGG23_09375 [Acidimicrobiales bacterium]
MSLDPEVRRDLRGLRKEIAEIVAKHLVAAGSLLEDDPAEALAHARYARSRAARIAVVREAAGLAAYHAGEWSEAIAELRAARRMGGGPGHLAVMADAERALGRPERALELARGPEARELGHAEAIELLIVTAGARRDLGETDAAVVSLQVPELDSRKREPWSARLFYAYADALLAAGRRDDALRWFLNTVEADGDELTDAADRLGELAADDDTAQTPDGEESATDRTSSDDQEPPAPDTPAGVDESAAGDDVESNAVQGRDVAEAAGDDRSSGDNGASHRGVAVPDGPSDGDRASDGAARSDDAEQPHDAKSPEHGESSDDGESSDADGTNGEPVAAGESDGRTGHDAAVVDEASARS